MTIQDSAIEYTTIRAKISPAFVTMIEKAESVGGDMGAASEIFTEEEAQEYLFMVGAIFKDLLKQL